VAILFGLIIRSIVLKKCILFLTLLAVTLLSGCGGGSTSSNQTTNTAPVANAGTNQSVVSGAQVSLNGAASSDANGNTLTYSWALTSKPANSNASLSNITSATPSFTADVAGDYVFSLTVNDGITTSTASVSVAATAPTQTVRLTTALGNIDITLYETAAPLTVANFLNYVNSGAYNNSFIHRSVTGFVIQGGGYKWSSTANSYETIPTSTPVNNEFSISRSNLRGTIAMAKVGNNPDSATSQWFINLADNASNLDNKNGGFTVFGEVSSSGMQVVDAIAALSIVNASVPFNELPLLSRPTSGPLQQENLVMILSATLLTN